MGGSSSSDNIGEKLISHYSNPNKQKDKFGALVSTWLRCRPRWAPAHRRPFCLPDYLDCYKSVSKIGELAFCKCDSLKSVTICNGMAVIADNAFYFCKSLETYTIFEHTIYEKQRDWTIEKFSEAIAIMISTKDYSVDMDPHTKYNIVVRVFLKTAQPQAEAYIKKNITRILPYFIDQNDFRMVKALFESRKFISDKNIRKFLNYGRGFPDFFG